MHKTLALLILSFILILTTNCGYHLHRTAVQIPNTIKAITIKSYDPYGTLTRAIYTELRLNNITVIDNDTKEKQKTLPLLRIVNASKKQITTSVLRDGKAAEYYITLNVQALVLIPDKDYYPIDVKIYRSFFTNPLIVLAEDTERDIIYQEMYQQAAHNLVQKLIMMVY